MRQQTLHLADASAAREDDDLPPVEFRKARMQLIWPPTVKQLAKELTSLRGLSLNEYALRLVVADLRSEGMLDEQTAKDLLRAAPTQPCKEKRAA